MFVFFFFSSVWNVKGTILKTKETRGRAAQRASKTLPSSPPAETQIDMDPVAIWALIDGKSSHCGIFLQRFFVLPVD